MKGQFAILLFFFSLIAKAQPVTIGIITDCQYCDCDYSERWNNDYRKAPERLKEAVEYFNAKSVDLVFHLGDFIDRDFKSYDTVNPIITKLEMPFYFVLGNHEFSVADSLKKNVFATLNLESPYYTVQKNNWLFVVLDGTDISPYSSADTAKVNFANKQLEHYAKLGRTQAKPWNGALGETQLEWLDKTLSKADANNLKSILLCHFPVLPKADLNLWIDVEVINILEKHASVKAYFNGHHHPGNYTQSNGIHYVTFQAMVRSQNETAFATVTLNNETITIKGNGREPNRVLVTR